MKKNKINKLWKKFDFIPEKQRKHKFKAKKPSDVAVIKHANSFVAKRWRHIASVRQNVSIWLLGIGVVFIAIIFQIWYLSSNYYEKGSVRGGTISQGVFGDIDTLNPLYTSSPSELASKRLIFSSLFRYDSYGKLSMDAATGYTVSKDRKSYDVKLRDDVLWHDGNKLTADDVVYTVKLFKQPAVGSNQEATWQDVDVKKIDSKTVRFTLASRYEPFPHALTFAILPKHILKNYSTNQLKEGAFNTKPVGSGPFKVGYTQSVKAKDSDKVKKKVVNLTRNDNYYHRPPKVKRFQLSSYNNRDNMVRDLRSSIINTASGVGPEGASVFDGDDGYVVNNIKTAGGVYLIFNTKIGATSDKEVRKALQVGTDVKAALGLIGKQTSVLDYPFIYDEIDKSQIKKPDYNFNKAVKILEDNGWKMNEKTGFREKDKQRLVLRLASLKDSKYDFVMGSLMGQWKRLGIDVKTNIVDPADKSNNFAASVLRPRDYDVLIQELNIGGDPDVYAYWHSSQATARGLNFANYENRLSDEALDLARSSDPEVRKVKYRVFAKQWMKDVPAIGLYRTYVSIVSKKAIDLREDDSSLITEADQYSSVNNWTSRSNYVYKTP